MFTRCISFVSYIKPQLELMVMIHKHFVYLSFPTSNHNVLELPDSVSFVVYLSFPTSNHNFLGSHVNVAPLYIFRFLHQTTTVRTVLQSPVSCISFVSYIKPQLVCQSIVMHPCCISFVSYIKPQLVKVSRFYACVVYLSFPTSNHNL